MLKKCFYVILMLAACPFAMGAASPAATADPNATSTATLVINVVSGTKAGKPVAGDKVLVRIFDHMNVLTSLEGTADANGAAVFEKIPTGPRFSAAARAKHGDMMFSSTLISLDADHDKFTGEVKVFDVSNDTSKLTVEMHHIFITLQDRQLQIVEFMKLKNDTDTAISSAERDSEGRPEVLDIRLPKGYSAFQTHGYLEEGQLVRNADGFYDTMAVPPGQFDLNFAYSLDINARKIPFKKAITHKTGELAVFSELTQAKLEGLGEPTSTMKGQDGQPIKYYRLSSLGPGDVVQFTIAGFNVGASRKTDWIVLAVVFALLGLLALWRFATGGKTS